MDRHNIIPVLEHYGSGHIHDRPGWQKMRCPFHEDTHASATVNTDIQAFNCFGCGTKGDVYKIIMQQEGVDFRAAYAFAERVVGEGNYALPARHTRRGNLPSNSGIIARRRGYSPPRVRRGAANGA